MINRNDIKKLLIDQNTTAATLAEALHITPQNLNCLLAKKQYTQKDLQRIAAALNLRYLSIIIDDNGATVCGDDIGQFTPPKTPRKRKQNTTTDAGQE